MPTTAKGASVRVKVQFDEDFIEGDYGSVLGLIATCTRCNHSVEVFGVDEASERRACATMREECPLHESNFYSDRSD